MPVVIWASRHWSLIRWERNGWQRASTPHPIRGVANRPDPNPFPFPNSKNSAPSTWFKKQWPSVFNAGPVSTTTDADSAVPGDEDTNQRYENHTCILCRLSLSLSLSLLHTHTLCLTQPEMSNEVTSAQVAINYVIAKGGVPLVDVYDADTAHEVKMSLGWKLTSDEVDMLDSAADLVFS